MNRKAKIKMNKLRIKSLQSPVKSKMILRLKRKEVKHAVIMFKWKIWNHQEVRLVLKHKYKLFK